MASIRARVLVGSPAAKAKLAGVIDTILAAPRDPAKLRADVEMRAEMARHKPARGPLDAKLARGGLVDLNSSRHYRWQLRDGVGVTLDLRAAIADLAGAGLMPMVVGGAYDR